MPGFLRALLTFLLFTALALVLDGVVACFTAALGGGGPMAMLAALLALFPLGLGAFHRGAGHAPLRARFVLLGFVGALPLASGFAPVSGLLILIFILPLRALGAQMQALLSGQRFGLGLLLLAWLTASAIGILSTLGLPLFLIAWAAAAVLLRYLVAAEQAPPLPSDPADQLQAFLLGLGLTSLYFFLRPYFTALDSGAANQDWHRLLGFAVVIVFAWITFGAGFGDSKFRRHALAACSLALALSLPQWSHAFANLSSPEGYAKLFASPLLRERLHSPDPFLSEDSFWYSLVSAIAGFGLPAALATVAVRCLKWPQALAPFTLGITAALMGCLLGGADMLPIFGTIAAGTLFAGALASAGLGHASPVRASVQVAVVLVFGGLFLRHVPRPEVGFPLRDAFAWAVKTVPDSEKADADAATETLQQATFRALPRWLERGSGQGIGRLFLADGRNLLQESLPRQQGRLKAALFAAALAPEEMARIAIVGSPDPASSQMLARVTDSDLTIACDPPALGRLAFRLAELSDGDRATSSHEYVASLAKAEGPFELVLIQGNAWWEERHAVLRSSLLRQAQLRLADNGVCVFTCSPEQLTPGILPAWLAEFRSVFPDMKLWLIPDDIEHVRLVIAGTLGKQEAWPPSAELSPALRHACAQLQLPIEQARDRDALLVPLDPKVLPAGPSFLFRAPWPPVDRLLAGTAFHPESGLLEVKRGGAVLAELEKLRGSGETADLLHYYADELAAQEYSVHDTYLTENPYAVEIDQGALDALFAMAAAHPQAASVQQLWRWATVSLVELREIGWLEEYLGRLETELEWEDSFVLLGRAHAAMEMLDFEGAMVLLGRVLEAEPDNPAALEMRPYAEAEQQLPRNEHAGHDHR